MSDLPVIGESGLAIIGTSRPPNASDLRERGVTGLHLPDSDPSVVLLRAKLELRQAQLKAQVRAYHAEKMASSFARTETEKAKKTKTGKKSVVGPVRLAGGEEEEEEEEDGNETMEIIELYCNDTSSITTAETETETEDTSLNMDFTRDTSSLLTETKTKTSATNPNSDTAPTDIANTPASQVTNEVSKIETAVRTLRERAPIQLRPYGLEREEYRQKIKAGGGAKAECDGK